MLKLDYETVRSVCSGQVITSPYSIVKELIENSLDAGAYIIDIRVEENGLNKIEIRDNGGGIKNEERHLIALPHFTSKLQNFSDISSVNTYGYRGEALSAVCCVATVTMITRHSSDTSAKSYKISKDGVLTETGICHNNIGTTFIVTELFKNLPVRKSFYQGKKGKEQFELIDHFVRGMALANPAVRFMLRNNKKLVWQHSSSKELKESLARVYGNVGDMVQFSYSSADQSGTQITGMLTASGKSPRKPPYYLINKRLVKFKALSKVLKKLYSNSFPKGAISITLKPSLVDVNVEVDKSAVICKNEAELISIIEKIVSEQVLNTLPPQDVLEQSQDFYDRNLASQSVIDISPDSKETRPGDSFSVESISAPVLESSKVPNFVTPSSSKIDPKEHAHIYCTPEILGGKGPTSKTTDYTLTILPERNNVAPNRSVIYSDDEEDEDIESQKRDVNMSIWSELEKDLDFGDDIDLFSPTEQEENESDKNMKVLNLIDDKNIEQAQESTKQPQMLVNIIDTEESVQVESKAQVQRNSNKKEQKQSSIMSWSQVNPQFKLEFISPEQIAKEAIQNLATKKRCKSASPSMPEKRRKIIATPSPPSKLPKNRLTFNLHYIRECLLFKKPNPATVAVTKAIQVEDKWVVLWENEIFAFNPNRAQEVNVYRKLSGSHSLKYGPSLSESDTSWDLRALDLGYDLLSFLMSCPTTQDPMGESSFIKEKSLAINGIRIKKVTDGLFRVTNVCEDVPDFGRDDVVETLELILQHKDSSVIDSENDIREYSSVRCQKICQYLKSKAAKMSGAFSAFQPTPTDVMDLFSNTNHTDVCVHGHNFREAVWKL